MHYKVNLKNVTSSLNSYCLIGKIRVVLMMGAIQMDNRPPHVIDVGWHFEGSAEKVVN